MRLKTLIIMIVILVISSFASNSIDDVSRSIVHHIEAGNFINSQELEGSTITMLHWFSSDVQVYSEDNEPFYFTVFQPFNGLTMYKNKKLIMQNELDQYPMYQSGGYMTFFIEEEDYVDNRVDFHTVATLDNSNSPVYDGNFFAGEYQAINKLIISKYIINGISKFLLIFAMILSVFIDRNKAYASLFLLSLFLIFYKIEIGLFVFVAVLYFYSDKLFKNKQRSRVIALSICVACVVPILNQVHLFTNGALFFIDTNTLYLLLFLGLSIYNYLKNKNRYSLISMLGISTVYVFYTVDYEFSFFRLFYDEIFMTIIYVTLLVLTNRNFRTYFSKDKTVKLDLLRGISHDLRVPISTISLNTEILEKDDFTSEMNKKTILHIIKGATKDLTNMTNSLTAYMSEDGYVSNDYHTSLQQSIHHVTRYYTNNEKNIEVKTDLCDEDIYLSIDEVWLNRLIYNLVDNAYKYTESYGEIFITLKQSNQSIKLSVEDNGIGMKKEELEKIIQPFYRVDESRSISGLGLGLSIVSAIIDQLDAKMHIESSIGEGTKFIIEI